MEADGVFLNYQDGLTAEEIAESIVERIWRLPLAAKAGSVIDARRHG
jgi:hypothetical protein